MAANPRMRSIVLIPTTSWVASDLKIRSRMSLGNEITELNLSQNCTIEGFCETNASFSQSKLMLPETSTFPLGMTRVDIPNVSIHLSQHYVTNSPISALSSSNVVDVSPSPVSHHAFLHDPRFGIHHRSRSSATVMYPKPADSRPSSFDEAHHALSRINRLF